MHTVTWRPGQNTELDLIYDHLREQQYQDRSQRLWKNYSKDSFSHAVALTIHFDDNNIPELCSSITARDCWPNSAYRILSRLWKHSNKISYPRVMSPSFGMTAKSQIDWLSKNTDCRLYFISRQTANWEDWCIRQFQKEFNLSFTNGTYKYLTCPNECDDTCWQTIIYNGNEDLLNQWKKLQ
jgi:hypothetical protein